MIFERVFSLILIIILLPFFLLFCLIIYLLDFSNPIFFGSRVGKNFKIFKQFKLRSMKVKNHLPLNFQSTSENDPRITKFGKFIRKTKIDELPQLFNILIGNMSFVGPRPQVLNDVKKYYKKEKDLLKINPGITDFASIVFADEGIILSNSKNPDQDYNLLIRYWKNALGLIYLENKSLLLDFYIIFLTLLNFINRRIALNIVSRLIKNYSSEYGEISNICLRKKRLKKKSFTNKDFLKLKINT